MIDNDEIVRLAALQRKVDQFNSAEDASAFERGLAQLVLLSQKVAGHTARLPM